jgi:hypothetical protein
MNSSFAWVLILALTGVAAESADLPTISGEHLYYLRARGQHLRKLAPDEMIEYCVAQKLGGRAFEDLYSQLFSMRIELTKLQRVEGLSDDDSRVKILTKTYAAYHSLLRDEAQKIQNGLVREGQVAAETLESLGRAQQQK